MKNLKLAISRFSEDFQISTEESISLLNFAINNSEISKIEIISEYVQAINDSQFDWIGLANDVELCDGVFKYSNVEILNYIRYCLEDFLFPETKMDDNEIMDMYGKVELVLRRSMNLEAWFSPEDICHQLKNIDLTPPAVFKFWQLPAFFDRHGNTPAYNGRFYFNNGVIPDHEIHIERKFDVEKPLSIGCFRYNVRNYVAKVKWG